MGDRVCEREGGEEWVTACVRERSFQQMSLLMYTPHLGKGGNRRTAGNDLVRQIHSCKHGVGIVRHNGNGVLPSGGTRGDSPTEKKDQVQITAPTDKKYELGLLPR